MRQKEEGPPSGLKRVEAYLYICDSVIRLYLTETN
jgi:hypothetical protein